MTDAAPAAEKQFCEKHTTVETSLRCNRCGRLMCAKCAVRTPTGYRCDDCVKGQQKIFDTATPLDYVLGPLVGGVLGFIGGLILPGLWFYLMILGAVFAGNLVAEAVRRVVGKRRSKRLFQIAAAAIFLGGFLPEIGTLIHILNLLSLPDTMNAAQALAGLFSQFVIWQLVYALLTAGSAYYSLAGIRL